MGSGCSSPSESAAPKRRRIDTASFVPAVAQPPTRAAPSGAESSPSPPMASVPAPASASVPASQPESALRGSHTRTRKRHVSATLLPEQLSASIRGSLLSGLLSLNGAALRQSLQIERTLRSETESRHQKPRVLLLGRSGAGKTLLLNAIKRRCAPPASEPRARADVDAEQSGAARTRPTSGIHEHEVALAPGLAAVFVDVGGSRNERRRWIHCFENVAGVLFVAPAHDLRAARADALLDEILQAEEQAKEKPEEQAQQQTASGGGNGGGGASDWTESLEVFAEVANSPRFRRTPFLLAATVTDGADSAQTPENEEAAAKATPPVALSRDEMQALVDRENDYAATRPVEVVCVRLQPQADEEFMERVRAFVTRIQSALLEERAQQHC